MIHRVLGTLFLVVVFVHGPAAGEARAQAFAGERLRLIVETDAGGDPDDEQSLVRFLLYAAEWDVEGIIANRPRAREGENRNAKRTGLEIVRALIDAYGQCLPRLLQHDPRYPSVESLLARTVSGYGEDDEAVRLVIGRVDADDPRPLWFLNWGTDNGAAPSALERALDRILAERSPEGYRRFKDRLRLSSADKFGRHTREIAPPFALWVDTFRPELEGRRWYHRFSALTRTAGGFDLERDVRTSHGPLGALYPTNTTHPQKEGDTMTFLYLVPTGMNDPEEPRWGSWAGRYALNPDEAGRHYYWASATDSWNGTSGREETLARWAADLQNDFRARLDWCVKDPPGANHPPRLAVNGKEGTGVFHASAAPGSSLALDASGTVDPDGDRLAYEWSVYPEAGTYPGDLAIDGARTPQAVVALPDDLDSGVIHVLLTVRDDGNPPLARYRRVVVRGKPDCSPAAVAERIAAAFTPPRELRDDLGDYRSPLVFDDGTPVRSAADWERRRAELRAAWEGLLGAWPPLLAAPRVEIVRERRRHDFVEKSITLETSRGVHDRAWLLVPDGDGRRRPAIVVVYYEPETSAGLSESRLRDFALALAERGFVTLALGTPGGGDVRASDAERVPCQPLSFHAYVAANAWQALANMPEVDPERIGITGHSYGGKWAMFAACLFERFACGAWSDPGIVFDETRPNVNYWEPWYLGHERGGAQRTPGVPSAKNPRTGAYKTLVEAGRDLHELHSLMAPRPFLVSGGSEDPPSRWRALNHTVAVNRLLGHEQRVAMTNRPHHDPTPASNAQLYAFFEHFLRPGH